MEFTEFQFYTRSRLKPALFIIGGFIIVFFGIAAVAGGFMWVQANEEADHYQDMYNNPEISQEEYATGFIDAVRCFSVNDSIEEVSEICDSDEGMTNTLISMTESTLSVNGDSYAITDQETAYEAVNDSELNNIDFQSMSLQNDDQEVEEGGTYTFVNDEGGSVSFDMSSTEGEDVTVSDIDAEPDDDDDEEDSDDE